METKPVVESLLYYSSNRMHLQNALVIARVINEERPWSAKENPELRNHLSHFERPGIIVAIGLIISVYVITRSNQNGRLYDVVLIEGDNTYINQMGKSKIVLDINRSLNTKDFMPQGNMKQIIWIPHKDRDAHETTPEEIEYSIIDSLRNINHVKESVIDHGVIVFTESIDREWTIDTDVSDPSPKRVLKTTQKEIIKNVVKEL